MIAFYFRLQVSLEVQKFEIIEPIRYIKKAKITPSIPNMHIDNIDIIIIVYHVLFFLQHIEVSFSDKNFILLTINMDNIIEIKINVSVFRKMLLKQMLHENFCINGIKAIKMPFAVDDKPMKSVLSVPMILNLANL